MKSYSSNGFYLDKQQLSNLEFYKYSSIDRSFLSRYILNPFWNRLVLLFPLWMAPNLITLIGLCFMISAVIVVILFPIPSPLIFLYIAFCISTYLNLDAIDGKQARRTGTSSPLGELFDHGCDAINMMLMSVLIPYIFGFSNAESLIVTLFGYAAFYASTWEEFHTGTLFLDYISGPVEGAWAIVLASFITFLAGGRHYWNQNIWENWTVKDLVPIIFIFGSISTIYTSIKHSRSTLNLKEFIIPSIYFLSSIFLAYRIPSHLVTWFIFFTGFPACFRISSTIISHLTKSPLHLNSFYPLEYTPIFMILLSFFIPSATWDFIFKIITVASFHVYIITMILVIIDICRHLDIYCLTIKHK